MTKEELYAKIALTISNYQPGDLMGLASLSRLVGELNHHFAEFPVPKRFLEALKAFIDQTITSRSANDFEETVTRAFDMFQVWREDLEPPRLATIETNLADFFKKPSRPPTNPDAEPTNRDPDHELVTNETFQLFLTEAEERYNQAQALLLELESHPGATETIVTLFRIFHTIKGECGFLRISTLGELTHAIETLLDGLRSARLAVTVEIINGLLGSLDLSREILALIVQGQTEAIADLPLEPTIRALGKLAQAATSTDPFATEAMEDQGPALANAEPTDRPIESPGKETAITKADQVVKVRLSKINFLVDMVGELLIALGQVGDGSPALAQIRKITRTIQYGAMELRTEKVKHLFGNVRRLVRDLAQKLNKSVRVEVFGEDLEIDRNLIEQLEEPLMHLVRNSLDHGLESQADRIAAGKDPVGTLTVRAERRGNHIVIMVGDDGRGLDPTRILAKAMAQNLVTADSAKTMSQEQIYNLIFVSGFSTSENVSHISGRGVGMDIVRHIVQGARGRITIRTELGRSTQFQLSFPLSTAIIEGMITRVGPSYLIVPITSIIESIKVDQTKIATVNAAVEVITLRDEVIPLVRLQEVFGVVASEPPAMTIGVIVELSDHRKFGLLVDEIVAKREVVIKTLGPKFRDLRGISSGTVLAGGAIGLVLDVDQVIELSQKSA